ncbi:hypothetical protein SFRURICE_002279 [Spodoptera frugiperda]|nr:hypothetical protein SFRURICE_002279 [Spodoptera frugiperda]
MIYTKQQWYTPAEVAVHNVASDCWVSLNGKVYNLTPWLENQFRNCMCPKSCSCSVKNWFCNNCVEYCPCFKQGYFFCDGKRLAMTILAYAGKDLSHWFKNGEWVNYIHPVTGSEVTHRTHGHTFRQPVVPSTRWRPLEEPWWDGDKYVVGSTVTLEVCSEETIYEIMMRYLPHNSHLLSYTWRYMGRGLCLNKNLEENGIPDERDRFSDVALPENIHIPAILIYYNDDLTEDPPRDECFCTEPSCVLKRPERCFKA